MTARHRLGVLVVAVAVLWATALAAQAGAALSATAQRAPAVSTAKWSVVLSAARATAATSGPVTAPLDADTYWWITNNGTATLSPAFGLSLSLTTTGGAVAQLQECTGGAWDEVAGTCSGTVSVIAQPNAVTAYTLPTAYPAGASLRLRLHVSSGGAGQTAVAGAMIRR